LISRFTEEIVQKHPDCLTIPHFIGASPSSTNLRQSLRRLCATLNDNIDSADDVPEDIKELLELFPDLLSKAAQKNKILIVLDAVNQFETNDNAHSMQWLPHDLPENVKLVASTLTGDAHDALLARRDKPVVEQLHGLDGNEIKELVHTYLKEIRHEFPDPQIESTFFSKIKKGNPLYILVALEELRVFGKFEALAGRISQLPDDVPALFDQVLKRIESDFNPALVGDCMSYIACGREGMTAEELQTLLADHAPPTDPQQATDKLPDMIWARLYRAFSSYLFERSGVIDFFHGQLKEAVGERYLHNEDDRKTYHQIIADYFEKRWQEPYHRAIDELPHQYIKAENWQDLDHVLTDLEFIEAKILAERVNELIFDYQLFFKAYAKCNKEKKYDRSNNDFSNRNNIYSIDNSSFGEIYKFNNFIIYSRNDLIRFGNRENFAIQSAYNYNDRNIHKAAKNIFDERDIPHGWISWDNREKTKGDNPCLFSLEPRNGKFLTMTLLSGSHSAVDLIATIDTGGNFTLWNSKTGVPVSKITTPPIGDSAMAVFCSNRNIVLFEPSKLTCLDFNMKTIWVEKNLPNEKPTALAVSHNFEFVLIGTQNKKIYIWDSKNHKMHGEIGPFKTYPKVILPLLLENTAWIGFSAMGRQHNDIIKLTINDIMSYKHIGSHNWTLYDLKLLGNDKGVLSVGWDGKLKKWDQSNNNEIHSELNLPANIKPTSCAIVKEDDTIICGDNKGDLWVRISISEEWKRYPNCHDDVIVNIKTFGLNRVLTLGKDNLIRFWKFSYGPSGLSEIRASKRITDIITTEDQKSIFWASNSEKGEFGYFHEIGGKYKSHSFTQLGWPIEKILITSEENYILLITNRGTCKIMRISSISDDINVTEKAGLALKEEDSAVDLTPDGRFLMVNASHEIYDLLSGAVVKKIDGIPREKRHYYGGRIESSSICEFAKQGDYAISIFKAPHNEENKNTAIYLISLGKGKGYMFRKYAFRLHSLSIHPNFEAVVVSGDNGYIEIINLPDGKLYRILKGHRGDVNSTRWTPDGQYIISAGNDKTVRVWNVKSGDEMIIYCLKAPVTCISNVNAFGQFVCGDNSGGIYLLSIHGIPFAPPYVNAVRKWQIESSENPLYWYPEKEKLLGKYESEVSFNCPYCRKRVNTTDDMFGVNVICPVCENTRPIQLVFSEGLDIIE
jgi:WD40 repeat protein